MHHSCPVNLPGYIKKDDALPHNVEDDARKFSLEGLWGGGAHPTTHATGFWLT
jgi:hypothetical protein